MIALLEILTFEQWRYAHGKTIREKRLSFVL